MSSFSFQHLPEGTTCSTENSAGSSWRPSGLFWCLTQTLNSGHTVICSPRSAPSDVSVLHAFLFFYCLSSHLCSIRSSTGFSEHGCTSWTQSVPVSGKSSKHLQLHQTEVKPVLTFILLCFLSVSVQMCRGPGSTERPKSYGTNTHVNNRL